MKNLGDENLFAEVIVDIQNSVVDKVFDYKISSDYAVGQRVLVPFGKRFVEGYIIKIKSSSDLEISKIKNVIKKLDDFLALNKEKIELMFFMKQRYNLRYIDILKLFFPSELRNGKIKSLHKTYISLTNENVSISKNAKNMLGIISYLKQKVEEEKSVLSKMFSLNSIKKLIEKGVLEERKEIFFRAPQAPKINQKNIVWNNEQKRAIEQICKFENKTYLLHGVTGSGKTEVYMGVIAKALENGKSAILLVPEISLTAQVLSTFRARFNDDVAILHSGLSAGEKFDEWQRIFNGSAKVVVGARSAIFAPLSNIGVIIIDEEHDLSYFSESNPRFFTHEIASFRSNFHACPLVLASATPSVESYYKAKTHKYELLSLPNRVNGKKMPKIQIVDMLFELKNGNSSIFSSHTLLQIEKAIKNKKQVMLFLNRRGFSSFMMCRECGYVAKCQDCDVSLVYHKNENVLKCHYCNKKYKALTRCPVCNSESIKQGAIGTERVVFELGKIFPNVKILRMDNDTTKTKNAHQKILQEFSQTKPAILVGTQMIAKGHDFADVTFVSIIDADQSLYHSDYKSAERTFSLITQMSGRAGRNIDDGMATLQTYSPKHYVYRFASNYDFEGFFDKEINLRKVTHFPPFSQIVRLLFLGENDKIVKDSVKVCYDEITLLSQKFKNQFYYLGVGASPITKIQKKFRYQIIMRFDALFEDVIIKQLYEICSKIKKDKISLFVEINPQNLS